MQRKDVLGKIDSDSDNSHGLPLPSELMRHSGGTLCALTGRPTRAASRQASPAYARPAFFNVNAVYAMRVLTQAIHYFGIVFAAGFTLAFIRIPFLVPRYGVRAAELMEIPVMLVVIGLASRWLQRRNELVSNAYLLLIGIVAFLMMVTAELGVALATSDLSLAGYVSSKDPVSGTAYLISLVIFALAPWFWSIKRRV